jgi:hypothetical protein
VKDVNGEEIGFFQKIRFLWYILMFPAVISLPFRLPLSFLPLRCPFRCHSCSSAVPSAVIPAIPLSLPLSFLRKQESTVPGSVKSAKNISSEKRSRY